MTFKIGDKVKCLETYWDQFTKGNIYTVTGIDEHSLAMIDDIGILNRWTKENFELVKEESMFKFGDKVRYVESINTGASEYPPLGTIHTIKALVGKGWIVIDGYNWCYNQNSFELVKEEPMFKVGDKVKCLETSACGLITKGNIYTVTGIDEYSLSMIDDIGNPNGWHINKFELVTLEEPKVTETKWNVDDAYTEWLYQDKISLRNALEKAYNAGADDMRNKMKALLEVKHV